MLGQGTIHYGNPKALEHHVGRTRESGGRSGWEERLKPRMRGGEPTTTREKREGGVWIVALILYRE